MKACKYMIMEAWKVFQKKKVRELHDMLAAHSMDTPGTNIVLVARLAKATFTDSNHALQVSATDSNMVDKNE